MPTQPPPGYGPHGGGWGGGYGSRDYLPDLGRMLASPWQRIAARLIDSLIVGALSAIALLIVLSDDLGDATDFNRIDGAVVLVSLLALGWEVTWVALRGATPGKLAMGIGVITQSGHTPPGWGPAFLRSLLDFFALLPVLGFVIALLEIASLVLLFADERRRTIPDRIATTYVVKTR